MKHFYFKRGFLCAFAAVFFLTPAALAQRQMEKLGRGVVALHSAASQAYVGWRLLATDPTEVGFNIYRSANGGAGVKLNSQVISNTTDFLDTTANFTVSNAWYVVPVINGIEQTPSASSGQPANSPVRQYLPLPLQAVIGGAYPPYDVKFCWVGDLDGDGEYDYVVDRQSLTTGVNQYLQAYKRDGTFLWQMDMGYNSTNQYNIIPGASSISVGHGDNVTVYDLDGDGKAEVIVRTARGVVFADGAVATAPDDTTQYISVLDGMTGHEITRALATNPIPADGPMNGHLAVMYCDGVHPSVLWEAANRNSSTLDFHDTIATWDYRNHQLIQRWVWIPPAGGNYAHGHQIRIADVNHDGKDDLVEIGSVNDGDTGQPFFDTEIIHGDRYHVTDIDPDRPGLETFLIQQNNPSLLATALLSVGDGKIIKKWYSPAVADVGRGTALDFDPTHRGLEFYSTQPGIFDCKGNQIFANSIWPPEAIWWDADLSRELEDGPGSGATSPVINKIDPVSGTAGRLYSIYQEGVHQAYGGRAAFWGDILGDWREELVLVANDYSELRVYTTKIQATNRLYCLMQNPQYRVQATCKGYYQASYVDYYLGNDMPVPAPPTLSNAKLVWRGNAGNVWDEGTSASWFTNNLWISNTIPTACNSGDTVLFDLTGSNNTSITLTGSLTPGDVRVHSPKNYTFDGGGALTGPMALTKAGKGKLTFNGTNTYTGGTLVAEGPFIVNGSLPSSPVTVRGGVWLDGRLGGNGVVGAAVSIKEGGGFSPGQGTNSPGTLTIASNVTLGGRTLSDFDLSDDPTGATKTNDLLVINGNLTLQGTNKLVINRLNTNLPPGTVYPLINYSGSLSGSLANLAVSGLTGIPVALTNPPGQIALVVKGFRAPNTITWTGGQGGNAWDLLVSSNWLNGAAKDQFAPGDSVRFDNTGASNITVNLTGDLTAAALIVDSTTNYTFTGSGGIIGSASLIKTNSGTLTLNTPNNAFTGRTVIAGGMLVVSELDGLGYSSPLGNPPNTSPTNLVLSGNATLRVTGESFTDRGMTLSAGTNTLDVFNSSDQLTMAGVITGSGALVKAGGGALALNVNNTYTGPTIINGGGISLGGGTANQYGMGPGPGGNGNTTVTLNNGRINMFSDTSSYDAINWNVYVPTNSTGTIYADDRCDMNGRMTNNGTLNFYIYYSRTTLYGDWSSSTGQFNFLSDSSGGDFRVSNAYGYANASVNIGDYVNAYHATGGGVSLGALSGGTLAEMSGTPWTLGAKNIDSTYAGSIYGNSVTKVGTGTLTLTGNTNTYAGATTISGGTLQIGGGGAAGTIGTGAITDNAKLAFNRSDAITDTNFGVISGAGALAKRGAGRLAFTKAHTYSGATTIEAGTLALTNTGSIANSSNIIISAGALFDVSGTTSAAMTLANGKTISGYGAVKGNFIIGGGAKLAPGGSIGTLTFSNSLTLAAGCTNYFEISKSPPTNDVANVLGALACGGTLIVTNLGAAAPVNGDTFKLFNAASYSGAFANVILPPLPAGLGWNTNALNVTGSISVIIATVPVIQSFSPSVNAFIFNGTGGVAGTNFYLLGSTNLAAPVANWVRLLTNQFDNSGNFNFTNLLDTNAPQNFYRLQIP